MKYGETFVLDILTHKKKKQIKRRENKMNETNFLSANNGIQDAILPEFADISKEKERIAYSLAKQMTLKMTVLSHDYIEDSIVEDKLNVRILIPQDLIRNIEHIFGCVFDKQGNVVLKKREDFNKIKAAFSEFSEMLTMEQVSEIIYSFETKLKDLSRSGVLDFDEQDCEYTATESVFYAFPMVATLEEGGVIRDFLCWADSIHINETISRLFREASLNIREPYTAQKVMGISKILPLMGKYEVPSSMFLLIKGVINTYGPIEQKKKEYKTYLATDKTGLIKIGRSSDVKEREKTLRTGNATLKIIAYSPLDIENELHKRFEDKHVRGEWFKLSKEEITNIVKEQGAEWVSLH